MILRAYSIYDSVAKNYSTPYFGISDLVATRNFSNLVRDSQSQVSISPEDYSLSFFGSFDSDTCVFTSSDRVTLCHASDFVPKS